MSKAVILLFLATIGWSHAAWLPTGQVRAPSPARVSVLAGNPSFTEFEIALPGIDRADTTVDHVSYARLSIPGEVFAVLTQGRPEVPKVSVLLGIPKDADVSVRVLDREVTTLRVANVYPLQPPLLDGQPPAPFTLDQPFYSTDTQYPGIDAALIETGVWRDLGVANIQVYPVQVNAGRGEVQVVSRIRVRVDHAGSSPERVAGWMVPTYARYIDNFARLRLKPETDYTAGVRYLVIAHSNWSTNSLLVDSLLGWVKKRGYDVRMISKSSYTAQEIKDSIRAEYNRYTPKALRWVLLVGEFAEIPMHAQGGVGNGDFWYKDLEPWSAGDNYPEIGLARLSPSSATDLQNQVRKILKYQKSPPATNSWLDRLTMVANSQDYPDKYSGCVRGIFNMPKPYWNPTLDTIMGRYKANADVTAAINAGVGILPYRGHGDVTEWWAWSGWPPAVSWYNSNVDALANGDLTPVVYNIACCNGDLSVSECLSEKWLRKYPGGAVASLGASQASYTYPNHGICSTLVRATCDTWTITVPGVRNYPNPVFNLADIHMRLDAYVAKYWPGSPFPDNIYMYNMLGDPAMPVWAGGMPLFPTVTHPATIPTGSYTLNVGVQVTGQPVEGALVCAWKGSEFYVSERTNNLGNAALQVNATTPGTVLITVSEGHARHSTPGVAHTPILPYEGSATVGVTHDVGCALITAPTGTVDSGTSVTPACSVANYGSAAETYTVRMKIGAGYNQTASVVSHPAGTRRYVTFPAWTALLRGANAVSCSTELTGDASPTNDKQTGSVLVRVDDVGCRALLAPSGTVDSGAVVTPACTVFNYGSVAATYNVRMRIGASYSQTASVASHPAGAALYVTFPTWTAGLARGIYAVSCSTELTGDAVPTNDRLTGNVTVRVLDAATVVLLAPAGTVDSGAVVTPACTVANHGTQAATYTVRMKIGTTYDQTATVTSQAAGARRYLTFPDWTAQQCITHAVSCSTELTGDLVPANNKLAGSVTVRARDVGCTHLLAPAGTVDSGAVVTPACSVANYSGVAVSYTVRMKVGSGYNQTASVVSHPAGTRRYVTFAAWTALQRGTTAVSCSTELTGDANPANDKQTGSVLVRIRDVGCRALLAPSGTVDSGTSMTPACTVFNYGSVAASYNVRMAIGSLYTNAATVLNQPPNTALYVTFPAWAALQRGSSAVSCSTALSGDQYEANNRQTGSVFVRVRDVGCAVIAAPAGIVDSGTVVTPTCTVANYGTTTETYDVRMRIGSSYDQTATIVGQAAGAQMEVTFPAWSAVVRGSHAVRCSTQLVADFAPANDRRNGSVDVRVPDVGCTAIMAPSGTVDSGTAVTPACTVANYGSTAETYTVRMSIGAGYDTAVLVSNHPAGTRRQVLFPAWAALQRGTSAVSCSTQLTADINPANDRATGSVDVRVHDVGCTAILAPAGTMDSGTVVTPTCSVANYGTLAETYNVRIRIGSTYDQTATVVGHAAGTRLEVTFPSWSAAPRGSQGVRCSTLLVTDPQPDNDVQTGAVDVTVIDVGCALIVSPAGVLDTGDVITPACTVANYGTTTETYNVRMRIGSTYDQTATVVGHAAGTVLEVTFPDWVAGPRGLVAVACSTELGTDLVRANDKDTGSVGVSTIDVATVALVAPTGSVPLGTIVTPRALVRNLGSAPATFDVGFSITSGYVSTRAVTDLARGDSVMVDFDDWLAGVPGTYATDCSTRLAGDDNPANDRLTGSVRVQYSWPSGWHGRSPMPTGPSGRMNKDGAWLTFDQSRGRIYAAKGNKATDFYSYSPITDSWHVLVPIPMGIENRAPAKGAAGCADGSGIVYATKGNNTQGFYKYIAARDSWRQLADVPLGSTGKKVKGGTDLAYVGGDTGFVYLLKGYRNEFWRYDPGSDQWQACSPAPAADWASGSWLAYDGLDAIYAHQAKYHAFRAYSLSTQAWGPALEGMPLIGRSGRSKKSKDGGAGTWMDGHIYALKGGSTQEFWRFTAPAGPWFELETMPQVGSSLRKKKVKAGADITATDARLLFALKGNRTNELWRYTPTLSALLPGQPDPRRAGSGITAEASSIAGSSFIVSPSPLLSGVLTVCLPSAASSPYSLAVCDAAGRRVLSQTNHQSSRAVLDLTHLPAGVYLVELTAGRTTASVKLVKQR